MIDHVCRFADEAAAKSALPQYSSEDSWDGSRCIPGITITVNNMPLPGFWIGIGLPEYDAALADTGALRFARNRDTGAFAYLAPDLDVSLLATAVVSPVFAGSSYSFG